MERLCRGLACYFRIWNFRAFAKTATVDDVIGWHAYWKVEPFGDDWGRTARQTLFMLGAMGGNVDETFLEKFMPNYDPNRPMTQDEIDAEMDKFRKRKRAQ